MTSLKTLYDENKDAALEELFTFLQFPSVSSEPEYESELLQCANWVMNYLVNMGFETELWETSGYPVVFGSHLKAGPDKPTLLIYNHYDVQPVDPIELWDTPPFEPTIRNGEIYARGAQDNKGQCFFVLQAIKLLLKRDGRLPINVKVCVEGEEEIASAGLCSILEEKKGSLRADYLAVVDTSIQSSDRPAVSLGTRGTVTMDVELTSSDTDLHSGSHGGIVFNPIHALVNILSKARDENGKITIPGFYDNVKPVTEEDKATLSLTFDEEHYKETFGAHPCGGEKGLHPLERAWLRPTLEINGISGGYTGKGFKTVIPAKAHAKISCRLVPDQDPHEIGLLVKEFIHAQAPEGTKVEVIVHKGVGFATRTAISSRVVQAFSQAFEKVFDIPCQFILEGASIPVTHELAKASGAELTLVGLGLPGDKIHAPNEHFGLDRLEKGCLMMAEAITNLTKTPK